MLVLQPLGRGFLARQDQLLLVLSLDPPVSSNEVICSWFLLVLSLEALGRGYTVTEAGRCLCWACDRLAGGSSQAEASRCLSGDL